MTFTSAIALLTALAASSSVHAQQINPADALNQATQTLAAVPSAPAAGADQIAALRQDFTDFASAYLAGSGTPATATAGAVGTSGRTDAPADWRARYQRVEADLAALLGPVGGNASAAPVIALDSDTRARLETVRSRLRMFYTATMSQPDGNPVAHTGTPQSPPNGAPAAPPPPVSPTGEAPQTPRVQPPTPTSGAAPVTGAAPASGSTPAIGSTPTIGSTPASGSTVSTGAAGAAGAAPSTGSRNAQVDTEWGTALAMLDRMERILNDATKEPGKINIDRGSIDEMRAEIAQIRAMLRGAVKN